MSPLVFQVEFLSDIVLPATSNTEGRIESLDFIAGSNFLGMVASEYDKFDDSFLVFHSGAVRFGDATILHEDTPTYKIPLSFFYDKSDKSKSKIINQIHHSLGDLDQAKQHRKGYITSGFTFIKIENNYAQKSAYDKARRRSQDGLMYGYSSIPKGTKWQFEVNYDNSVSDEDIERIKANLLGKKRLGKSKSSQYGQIEIVQRGEIEQLENKKTLSKETIVYAKSRLALIDNDGNPTCELKYLVEGLEDKNIDYNRCQIKTSSFTPYNRAMQTKTYERLVIEKGSVIVLQELTQAQFDALQKGVGLYLAEGFGELLINPSFLMEKDKEKIQLFKKTDQEKEVETPITDDMVKFLFLKDEEKRQKLVLAAKVHEFIEQNQTLYSKSMNAQWGTIRSLCASSSDEAIFYAVQSYITSGVAKDKWSGEKSKQLLCAIKKSNSPLAFTKLLAMEMPKIKDSDKEGAKR